MFGQFLGPKSFNSPKGPLACKQASLPITFDGIGLILTSTIAPIAYLGSWALIVSVIASRFMVDQRSFFFETLAQVDNNTFLFQQHLKATCDLLPPPTHVCLLPFEQFIKQQMVQLQDSISKHLHHHTLSSMLFVETSKAHYAQILSCFGPRVGT
jgi:hypothetical protein